MALEDFTSYTETDPSSHISVAANTVTVSGMVGSENARVAKDYGASHFGQFQHDLTVGPQTITATDDGYVAIWQLSAGDGGYDAAATNDLFFYIADESDSGWQGFHFLAKGGVDDEYVTDEGWNGGTYYIRIERTGAATTCKIYSDSDRTTLIATLSTTFNSAALRWLAVAGGGMANSPNDAGAVNKAISLTILDLDIHAATCAVTGTATETIDEADIVAGGKTIIVTLTDDTYVPASGTTAITQPASALGSTTTTTSFSIVLPTTATNDILILEFCHRGTSNGTIAGTSVTTGGLTWTHKHNQLFATSTFSGNLYWTRATGDHAGQTVTGAALVDSCAAILKVKRGCVTSGDPFTNAATIVGEQNASGNETQAEITTLIDGAEVNLTILNSPDLAVSAHSCGIGALANEVERLSTGGTDSSISSACAVKATAGATGAFVWAQTNAAGGSYAYALTPAATTPFNDARQAIIDGLNSAQAEGTGWNAEVRDNLAVTTVVRTSNTICTITLSAQVGYDITAQETITVTLPASALTGAEAIVGTPTFTVDTDGGAPASSILLHLLLHG